MKLKYFIGGMFCLTALSAYAEDANFVIEKTQVQLTQKFENPEFYTQAQIEQRLDACVKEKIMKLGKLAEQPTESTIRVSIQATYQRVYNGEAFGSHSSVGSPIMGYQIVGSTAEKKVFDYQASGLKHSYGFFGNVVKSVSMGLDQTKAEDENQYIDTFCKTIATLIVR